MRWLVTLACACSTTPPAASGGKIITAITLDWEGAELAPESFTALAQLRKAIGPAPITHFVSAAYFGKDKQAGPKIAAAIQPGDELAVHLHAWRSLAVASGIAPRVSPSFLTGTDEVVELEGDAGFDTDLDTYDVPALRALLRTSRKLLEQTHVRVSHSFRAGGYLATPKVLLAARDEGFTVDSSAVDRRALADAKEEELAARLGALWPNVDASTQPVVREPGLLEMPIAGVTDYVSATDIVQTFERARARLRSQPDRDVFVVLAFHLETAPDYAARLQEALAKVGAVQYVTIEEAAELFRFQ